MFNQVIVVGTGKFAFLCAQILRKECNYVKIFEHRANENISILEKLCKKNNIEYQLIRQDNLYKYLLNLVGKCLIVSAFNTYIFDSRFFNIKNILIINYHPALLPLHPGRNSEAWSIFEEDSETGITWHVVEEQVDKGDIIIQKKIRLDNSYTSLSLMIKQNQLGIVALKEICHNLLSENFATIKQESKVVKYHKSFEIPNKGYINIDWNQEKIYAFLRAMDYGKLNLLGYPKIVINNEVYTWKSYEYIEDDNKIKLACNDFLISKNIVLRNRKKYI